MSKFLETIGTDEIHNVPENARPFLVPTADLDNKQTWAFYAYGFEAAFYELLDEALANGQRRDYLQRPVVHLCRHSIELSLKYAIVFVSRHTGGEPRTGGHNLIKLWSE